MTCRRFGILCATCLVKNTKATPSRNTPNASRIFDASMATQIITYDERYKTDFARLNFAWIEQYFVVEKADRKYLLNPHELIVAPGGEVFFVLENHQVLGTCALLKTDESVYELVKMAVDKNAQGKGLANLLMQAAIDWACAKNAKRIFLESNTVLATAIKLYEKFGFKEISLEHHTNSEYARVNIVMELRLR